jgi:hypothetical protein
VICTANTEQLDIPSDSGIYLFVPGKMNFRYSEYMLNFITLNNVDDDEEPIYTDESGIIFCLFCLLTVIEL